MFNDEFIDKYFKENQERIEECIQKEYHEKIKGIKVQGDEKNNIKMNIISELYYKQGVKDGVEFILKMLKK